MILDWKGVLAIGALLAVGVVIAKKDATAALQTAGAAVNPVSSGNVAYQGVSSLANALAPDGQSLTIGQRLYDVLN